MTTADAAPGAPVDAAAADPATTGPATGESATADAGAHEVTRLAACPLCEASCGIEVTLRGHEVTAIRGHRGDPLSRGHLCPKGVALQDIHTDPDRLRRPVRRVGEGWVEMEWDEAIDLVARRLVEVQREHGRDAVAVYQGNPNVHSLGALTHGAAVARALRSRNTFSATSVDQLPHHVVAWALYGHQFLLPIPDIDRTDLLVLLGTNPMASNGSLMTVPDFPQRVRELHARGGRMVVLDPRRTETAKVADEHVPIRPGTDAFVLLAMVREVLERDLAAPAAYVDGVERVREVVAPFTPELAQRASGVPAETIRSLADQVATSRAAVHGRMGMSTQEFGVVAQWAAQTLMVLTGNLDREGGTLFTHPAVDIVGRDLVGRGHLGRWASRVRGAPEFGGELPVSVLAEEMTTPGEGQVRALLTIAGNPVSSTPAGHRLAEAVGELDFVAAVDFYIGETTQYADVILPPTGPLERDHYDLVFHALAVRNTARFTRAVLPAAPDSRHDWQIARDLALAIHRHRGSGLRTRARTWARLAPSPRMLLAGLLRTGPARLSVSAVSAPGGVDLGPLRPSLPGRLRTRDQRIDLAPAVVLEDLPRALARLHERAGGAAGVEGAEVPEAAGGGAGTDGADGELLLIGRRQQRDNNSWLHNVPRLTRGRPRHRLLIHPDDAQARGVETGGQVRVRSAVGEIEVEAEVTGDVMPGVVSLPHGWGHARPGVRLRHASALPGASVNDLTDPAVLDAASGNAVLNGVPVTVTASPAIGRA